MRFASCSRCTKTHAHAQTSKQTIKQTNKQTKAHAQAQAHACTHRVAHICLNLLVFAKPQQNKCSYLPRWGILRHPKKMLKKLWSFVRTGAGRHCKCVQNGRQPVQEPTNPGLSEGNTQDRFVSQFASTYIYTESSKHILYRLYMHIYRYTCLYYFCQARTWLVLCLHCFGAVLIHISRKPADRQGLR